METEDRYRLCETARVRGGLTVQDLWLRYLALGGNHDAFDIDGYLHGLLSLENVQERVLVVALNERLDEVHRRTLIPLPAPASSTARPHHPNKDDHLSLLEELFGGDRPQPRPADQTD